MLHFEKKNFVGLLDVITIPLPPSFFSKDVIFDALLFNPGFHCKGDEAGIPY